LPFPSDNIVKWIPYSQFIDIKKIGKDDNDFVTIYSAIWNDNSLLYYYTNEEKWIKEFNYIKVALKSLDNSQNMINELLDKV
jgi:hypothetical protein